MYSMEGKRMLAHLLQLTLKLGCVQAQHQLGRVSVKGPGKTNR